MLRVLTALLVGATLVALGWHAHAMLAQVSELPGMATATLLFHGVLALPYALALALMARGDGRGGQRLAFGAALINAIWSVPLAALMLLFAGFTLGDRAQQQALTAVAAAALAQLLLLAAAGIALRRARALPPSPPGWLVALLLPVLVSGGAWLFLRTQIEASRAASAQAARNDRAAQQTVKALQDCLTGARERGYPAGLDDCPAAAATTPHSGYRFEYLRALPAADGRSAAWLLCARPLRYRETGFSTVLAGSDGFFGAGIAAGASRARPPTCASVVGIERAIAWCAYAQAMRDGSYPARLQDVRDCVGELRPLRELGPDRASTEGGEVFAYVSAAPDAQGRRTGFRIYRLTQPGGRATWLDDTLRDSTPPTRPSSRASRTGRLPAEAAPEAFEPGCAAGVAADCFLAGYEWERRRFQTRNGDVVALLQAAARAWERGCTLGDALSCTSYGGQLERGEAGLDRDVVRAAAAYETACDRGDGLGCADAAEMHRSGRKARLQMLNPPPPPKEPKADLPADPLRAVALHRRACELGERDSCFIAARILAEGEGTAPDREAGLQAFESLCEDGWALACARAAALSPRDAADLLRRGCALGEATACIPAAR